MKGGEWWSKSRASEGEWGAIWRVGREREWGARGGENGVRGGQWGERGRGVE